MNTWMRKMVAWQQRFVRAAESREPRLYWDGRARRWNLSRALVPIETRMTPKRNSRFIE